MKKSIKSGLAILLIIITVALSCYCLIASAAEDYSSISENQYISRVLLNYKYNGAAKLPDENATIPQKEFQFYLTPKNVSNAKALLEAIEADEKFMASFKTWEIATFSPGNITDKMLDEKGYYTAIIVAILNKTVSDPTVLKVANCSFNKTVLSLGKSMAKLVDCGDQADLKALEKIDIMSMTDSEREDIFNRFVKDQETSNFCKIMGKDIGNAKDFLSDCKNLVEFVKTWNFYESLSYISQNTKTVLNTALANCPRGNKAMYNALEDVCRSFEISLKNQINIMVKSGEKYISDAISEPIKKFWSKAVTAALGYLGESVLIGQDIGKTIANFAFSTDKLIEQYYALGAIDQFTNLMANTVKVHANKFKQNDSRENADNFIESVKLLMLTYNQCSEYALDYAKVVYEKGAVNTFRSLFGRKDQTYENFKKSAESMKTIISNAKDSLINIEAYAAYYEIDAPLAYRNFFLGEEQPIFSVKVIPISGGVVLNENNEPKGFLEYKRNSDGTMTLVRCHQDTEGEVVIPVKIGGRAVTTIGANAFNGCNGITDVTIPDSVTSIGIAAFYCCSSLTSITIPDSVTSIGERSFYRCSSLTGITIPDSVTSIGDWAFCGCSSLSSVTIPDSVTSIGYDAFADCSSLTSVTIGNSIRSIGRYAFCGCSSLASIKIPDSVTDIGDYAFLGCNGLVSVVIGNGVESLNGFKFKDNKNLTNVVIGNSIMSIDYEAFKGCSSLTSVTIGNSVKSIVSYAFYDCSSLTGVTIPDSVTSIGSEAFGYCSKLTSVTIGKGVTSIGRYAFYGCSSLASIKIPDSVTDIGGYAFENCEYLSGVKITNLAAWCNINFANQYSNPLYYANNLYINDTLVTDLIIPDSVTSIGKYAFYGCSSLTSVTIPDSVTSIGSEAFYYCSKLKSIKITDIVAWCNINFANYSSNPLYYAHNLYINDILVTDLTIPDSVTSIRNYVFCGCRSLANVTIPDSITSIGVSSFYGCSSLTSVTIPDSVTSIDNYAFYNCSGLTNIVIGSGVKDLNGFDFQSYKNLTGVVIGNGITTINAYQFKNCDRLTSITIPDSVTSIGEDAFDGCYYLTNVKITDLAAWCNIDFHYMYSNPLHCAHNLYVNDTLVTDLIIPDSVTSIGNYAFYDCRSLKSVTIPDSVTSIGDDAFYYCRGLTSVTISDSVTSIGDDAFGACNSLTNVTIPNSVISIGEHAFSGCGSLTSVTIPDSVKSIGYEAFWCCYNLTSVKIADLAAWCNIDFNNYMSNPLYYAHNLYVNDTLVTDLIIPNSVTSIDSYAFEGCSSLNSVTIPDSVMSIDSHAFEGCCNITDTFYAGTKDEWNKMSILPGNESLCANIYFNHPTGHSFGEWFTTKDATLFEDGEEARICSICDKTETRKTEKLGSEVSNENATIIYPETAFEGKNISLVTTVLSDSISKTVFKYFERLSAFDISILLDSELIQPKDSVWVKVILPDGYNADTTSVYYVADDGTTEKMNSFVKEGYVYFEATHFSEYAVVDESSEFNPADNCDHICHKSGIMRFFYKIARLFWKLFKTNKTCSCGMEHY